MNGVRWDRYGACPVCGATRGEACLTLSGYRTVVAARPHAGRRLLKRARS